MYEIKETERLVFLTKEAGSTYQIDLRKRTFDFAVDVILFLKTIPYTKENDVIRYQLAKAGTSIGANYEESQATNSRLDFRHKVGIALKEARESNYWLRNYGRNSGGNLEKVRKLIKESIEIKSILAAIFNKVAKYRTRIQEPRTKTIVLVPGIWFLALGLKD